MTSTHFDQSGPFYQNPIYPRSFPDPYVLKHGGEYYAYCTGHSEDGRVFGVLHSSDLLNWVPLGGAMAELETPEPFYWAPEVTYWNGRFFLYYSVGNETFMQLRVATSDRPDGGFQDAGVRLTKEDFAIDAHVFIDDDGQRYLFYATDFLEHSHIGTGVVVDRMVDWYTLAGDPRPVVRAKYDWQVYDPARKEKGGVRWHTVEGPFVLKRKGRYFMMFSGGNWQQPTYGVSFALADDLTKPEEWRQFSDGKKVLPILRTEKDHQIGPGHNSVVRGPNNRDLYCVYHYWHEGSRVLAANRMDFAGPRIFVESRPYLPKMLPLPPSSKFKLNDLNWKPSGTWKISDNSAKSTGDSPSSIRSGRLPKCFLCEFSFKADEPQGGLFELRFEGNADVLGGIVFRFNDEDAVYEWVESENEKRTGPERLGKHFAIEALHRITIEADHSFISVRLDDSHLITRVLPSDPLYLSLFTDRYEVAFSGFELTEGFEDRFELEDGDAINLRGWHAATADADLNIRDQELIFVSSGERESAIYKGDLNENFEFAANIRLNRPDEPSGSYGFVLLNEENSVLARFEFQESDGRNYLSYGDDSSSRVRLPSDFDPALLHQFRFRKELGSLYFDIETVPLGSVAAAAKRARMGVFGRNASVVLEMVRLTVINS